MSKHFLVSIIIPIFNVEPYIERCLMSALNQTYQNIEIILVDDCGQDNSMVIAKQIIENHPNDCKVHILKHEHNRGLSVARNTGIEAATGEYIYFLDSDDEITLDCIEKLSKPLEKQELDFVIGNYQKFLIGGKISQSKLKQGILYGNDKILHDYLTYKWYELAVNKLLNKKFMLDHKLFFAEGLLNEDILWSFMLACQAKSMGMIQDCTYNYYKRDGAITQIDLDKGLPHLLRIVQELRIYAVKNDLSLNVEAYNYIEMLKLSIFYRKYDSMKHKQIYAFFRENVLPYPLFKNMTMKKKLFNVHYKLPLSLGYYVYELTTYLLSIIHKI